MHQMRERSHRLQRHSRQAGLPERRKILEKAIIRKRIARMADGADKDEHHGTGHRSRLRTALLEQGGDALLDHELDRISSWHWRSRAKTPSRSPSNCWRIMAGCRLADRRCRKYRAAARHGRNQHCGAENRSGSGAAPAERTGARTARAWHRGNRCSIICAPIWRI